VSTAERKLSAPIVEAYLVEEWSDNGGHDTVYEATPLEPTNKGEPKC